MISNTTLPPELYASIGSETTDFTVMAGRSEPLKKTLQTLIFSLIWTAFTGLIVAIFIGPLLLGEEVHFKTNGVPTVASQDNLKPIIFPALILSVFLIVGFGMLGWSLYKLFQKGGYFAGTPTRLVHFNKGNIRSIDWEQFSGDIEVGGNAQKGNISLQMRTGKMVSQKNGPSRYVPDYVYIAGIPDAFEIEKICRKRIEENDPTPTNNQL